MHQTACQVQYVCHYASVHPGSILQKTTAGEQNPAKHGATLNQCRQYSNTLSYTRTNDPDQ